VGGYFGAQYARAGHDVLFVARGAHLAALRERGLSVESTLGAARIHPVDASDDPAAMPAADVILFCTKLWDVEAAAQQLAASIAAGAVAVTVQNGVDSHRRLAQRFGAERVGAGVAHISATIRAPGVIEHVGAFARLRVGTVHGAQPDGHAAQRLRALVDAGRSAGVDIEVAGDIERTLWEKFVFLAAFSGVTSLARQPVGVVRSDADLRATLEASMRETQAVAAARGIVLDADFVAQQMAAIDRLPAQMRSSMLNDLLGRRRLEAPWLAGAVVRMADEAGLAAPVNRVLYAALKPYVDGAAPAV
jgi:2-dehydropantoate 2-reductase